MKPLDLFGFDTTPLHAAPHHTNTNTNADTNTTARNLAMQDIIYDRITHDFKSYRVRGSLKLDV